MSKTERQLLNSYPDTVHRLIEKARNISIIPSETSTQNKLEKDLLPVWLDADAIRKGRQFASKHFFLVFFTHFISLILLLSYIPVRLVLMKTGKSHTQELALNRYLSTLRHVKLWYESDLHHEASEGVRDIVKVRKIHEGVAKRIKQRMESKSPNRSYIGKDHTINISSKVKSNIFEILKHLNPTDANISNATNKKNLEHSKLLSSTCPPTRITQLDMIVTQYCFMGLLTTFPKKFGIVSKQDLEGLQGFVHIWAVIGHLLGIQDQFNLCIGDDEKMLAVKQFILKEILLFDLFTVKEETYQLWDSLVKAMSEFVPCLSIHAALLYILDQILELDSRGELYNDSSLGEKLSYQLTINMFTFVFKVSIIRNVFNNLLRLAIYLTALRLNISKIFISGK